MMSETDHLLRIAFDAAPIGKALIAPDGTWLRVNPALCTMTGYSESELLAGRFPLLDDPRALSGDLPELSMEKHYRRADGSQLWGQLTVALARDAAGEPEMLVCQMLDITQRRQQERTLRIAEQQHRMLLDRLPDAAVFLTDRNLCAVSMRGSILTRIGLDSAEYIGRSVEELLPSEPRHMLMPLLRAALEGNPGATQYQSSRSQRSYRVEAVPLPDPDGTINYVMGVARDVTSQLAREHELDASRAELAEAKRSLEAVLTHTPTAVYLKDRHQTFLLANEETARILGRTAEEILGKSLWDIYDEEVVARLDANDRAVMEAGEPMQYEEVAPHFGDEGRQHTWLAVKFPVADAAGEIVGVGGISLDITDRKEMEARLQELADHDSLTGLLNRRRFYEELVAQLGRVRRYGGDTALLVLDLDGFKDVNDTFGHATGDVLVQRLAGVLHDALRDTDVVARTGGDEFAIVLPEADLTAAEHVAAKVLADVQREGHVSDGTQEVRVTASIGITTFGPADVITAEDLLIEGDVAMYEAKSAGKNRYAVHRRAVVGGSGSQAP